MKTGQRVRFLRDNLGASLRDALYVCTGETYGSRDEGTVSFPHPNQRKCKGWFYVEVDSKAVLGEKRYVGVAPNMIEIVGTPIA